MVQQDIAIGALMHSVDRLTLFVHHPAMERKSGCMGGRMQAMSETLSPFQYRMQKLWAAVKPNGFRYNCKGKHELFFVEKF